MSDLLATVVAAARRAADDREQRSGGADHLLASGDAVRRGDRFVDSLREPGIRIIAECKRRSPSRGVLRQVYDPASIARSYAAAGAAAISVPTEPTFFDGSLDHLREVRSALTTPLLRKDFIVTEFQIAEAAAAGADAILLIVAALDEADLVRLLETASRHGLAVLVEVHDAAELDRALGAGATIVGVNSRNLRTLDVNLAVFDTLADRIPPGVIAVAESGLRTAADLARLRARRFDAFLIGERFMAEADPGAALLELRHAAEVTVS